MCRKALDVGLTGIALTEHDTWWPVHEIEMLRRQFPDLAIFRGAEYTCPEGHFLIFLPDIVSEAGLTPSPIKDSIHRVHSVSGIVIWAHPFRFDRAIPHWLDDVLLDGIEVASTNMDREASSLAIKIAGAHGIPPFENSDAHLADTIGIYRNKFPCRLRNNQELIDYIRKGH
jgi:predicted metal-dependent phosphoesterase TrpH